MAETEQYPNDLMQVWSDMHNACYVPTNTRYMKYGYLGYKMDDRWEDDPKRFYRWAMEKGYKDGMTVKRTDDKKDFTPANCKLITGRFDMPPKKGNSIYIDLDGDKRTINEWAEYFHINRKRIQSKYEKEGLDGATHYLWQLFDEMLDQMDRVDISKNNQQKPYVRKYGIKFYYLKNSASNPNANVNKNT